MLTDSGFKKYLKQTVGYDTVKAQTEQKQKNIFPCLRYQFYKTSGAKKSHKIVLLWNLVTINDNDFHKSGIKIII